MISPLFLRAYTVVTSVSYARPRFYIALEIVCVPPRKEAAPLPRRSWIAEARTFRAALGWSFTSLGLRKVASGLRTVSMAALEAKAVHGCRLVSFSEAYRAEDLSFSTAADSGPKSSFSPRCFPP